jgi:hypothetical protein
LVFGTDTRAHSKIYKRKKRKRSKKKRKKMNNITGTGWNTLIDKAIAITEKLEFANIESINTEHGMLKIKFTEPLDKTEQYILDCLSYKLERESARLCETCGEYGLRRQNLPVTKCLCTKCYTLEYNELMESVSPTVTNQPPQ